MEYIILGFVLFIIGVASTIAYDKYKAHVASRPIRVTPIATPKSKSKSISNIDDDLLSQFTAHMKAKGKPESTFKSKPITAKDIGLNSTMTVQELKQKLESLKKNL